MIKWKMKHTILLAILFLAASFILNSNQTYAQVCGASTCNPATEACIGGFCITKPLKDPASAASSPQTPSLGYLISRAYLFIAPIVGMLGFVMILFSGVQFLTSKGDPKALEAAKARLTYTIIGLVIFALAYAISLTVQYMFGIGVPQPI